MENNWKYKIELRDSSVFDKLAKLFGTSIPEDLRAFVIECNAAYPENNHILIEQNERIFQAVLSFNEYETEATSVFDLIDGSPVDSAVPFGLDPFGNVFYYSLADGKVLYWEHEENSVSRTEYSLDSLIANLF